MSLAQMFFRWASVYFFHCAALEVFPLGIAAGSHDTEIRIPKFGATDITSISLRDAATSCGGSENLATASFPCVDGEVVVLCNVSWPTSGQVLATVSPVERRFVFTVYDHPAITHVTPLALARSGGDMLRVSFSKAVLFDNQQAVGRLHAAGVAVEFDMVVDRMGASGHTPNFERIPGATVSFSFSLNGVNFQHSDRKFVLEDRPKLQIGFIFVGLPDDFGWTYQHNLARLSLESRFLGRVSTSHVGPVEAWGPNECNFCAQISGWNASSEKWETEPENFFPSHRAAVEIKRLVDSGAKMIVATSFWYQWDVYYLARHYPNVYFIHVTGWLTRANMAQVFPRVFQARYLSGIIMGWYLKKHNLSKRVGYVFSYKLGETVRGINAFKLGLEAVDPEIQVFVTEIFAWYDPRKETLAARRLIRYHGVEAIAQHVDSHNPQLAARSLGKIGAGYNSHMLLTVGDTVLTSPMLNWEEDLSELVQDVLDGTAAEKNLWNGGRWELSKLSPRVPLEARAQIKAEMDRWLNGKDDIFCKPNLRDNKGRLRNALGQPNPTIRAPAWEIDHLVPGTSCLTDAVIKQSCQEYDVNGNCIDHWLLQGVVENCEALDSPCFLGPMKVPPQCPEGQHLMDEGCTLASPGFHAVDEQQMPCPVGFEARHPGQSRCTPCQPGHIAAFLGTEFCEPCRAGRFAEKASLANCSDCPAGSFTETSGTSRCTSCAVGRYASSLGSSACTACDGFWLTTSHPGSSTQHDCVRHLRFLWLVAGIIASPLLLLLIGIAMRRYRRQRKELQESMQRERLYFEGAVAIMRTMCSSGVTLMVNLEGRILEAEPHDGLEGLKPGSKIQDSVPNQPDIVRIENHLQATASEFSKQTPALFARPLDFNIVTKNDSKGIIDLSTFTFALQEDLFLMGIKRRYQFESEAETAPEMPDSQCDESIVRSLQIRKPKSCVRPDEVSTKQSLPSSSNTAQAFAIKDSKDLQLSFEKLYAIGVEEQWLLPTSEVAVLPDRVLGVGGFAVVVSGQYNGSDVAIKAPKLSMHTQRTSAHLGQLCNELRLLRRLRHPNIVTLYGACLDSQYEDLALVMEPLHGQALSRLLVNQSPSSMVRVQVMADVAAALRYLHGWKPPIVHSDLKDSNIFVEFCSGRECQYRAKLLDFGLSMLMTKNALWHGGTVHWMAPEMVKHGRASPSSDIFSFGRVVFFVVTGTRAHSNMSRSHLKTLLKSGHAPAYNQATLMSSFLGPSHSALIDQCSNHDPVQRPDIVEVQQTLQSAARDSLGELISVWKKGAVNGVHEMLERARETLLQKDSKTLAGDFGYRRLEVEKDLTVQSVPETYSDDVASSHGSFDRSSPLASAQGSFVTELQSTEHILYLTAL